MQKIKNGFLYAELRDSKKKPEINRNIFYNIIIIINKTNLCGHISEVILIFYYGIINILIIIINN